MTHTTVDFSDHVTKSMIKIYSDPKKNRIAEYTSACSHSPSKFVCPVSNARDAMAALYLVSMIIPERAGVIRIQFTDHIAQMAYNFRYEGDWKIVQEILELKTFMPYFVGKILFENMTPREYYGNFEPLLLIKWKQCKMLKLHLRQKGRVVKPKRKRGYDDKGTLRPDHRWLPTDVHLGPNPEPEDYRSRSYTPRNRHFWQNNPKGDPPL